MGFAAIDHTKKARKESDCIHCGTLIPEGFKSERFCCTGCEYVYQLIHKLDLSRFYEIKDKKTQPLVNFFTRRNKLSWLDPALASSKSKLYFKIESIQCTACVWLIRKLAQAKGLRVSINTVLGEASVEVESVDRAILLDFFQSLQNLGYPVGPISNEQKQRPSRALLVRLGLCALMAINAMGLAASSYLGLDITEPEVFRLVHVLLLLFGSVSVLVGGTYFFKKSFISLKNGLFHFDVPISMGILLAYGGSVLAFALGRFEKAYFDSLSVFIFLMLAGRYLQNQWILSNRSRILDPIHFDELEILVAGENGKLSAQSFTDIKQGDEMVLKPGSIVPVNSSLLGASAQFDMQWISGESEAITVNKNSTVRAGSRYLGAKLLRMKAGQAFSASRLIRFSSDESDEEGVRDGEMQDERFSKAYVVLVFLLMGLSTAFNLLFYSWEQALISAVTISVVTCPCGIGLAIPMVRYFIQNQLLGLGVFIRNSRLFDRLGEIEILVFDKTGTLTLSEKKILNTEDIDGLSEHEQSVLLSATSQSHHPVSQSIFHALIPKSLELLDLCVEERIGQGLFFKLGSDRYELKSSPSNDARTTVDFLKNDQLLLRLNFSEALLEGADRVLLDVQKRRKVFLLSGDQSGPVKNVARQLGIPKDRLQFQCSPEDKARFVKKMEKSERVLFVGDGLNDVEAMRASTLAGASLGQNAFTASVADFYFNPASLNWLLRFLELGQRFHRVFRANVIVALIYNILISGLAMLGKIGPLEAAIIMPIFSVVVVSLSGRFAMKT